MVILHNTRTLVSVCFEAVPVNRDYMLLFSQKEIDDLLVDADFSFVPMDNHSERPIVFDCHL